MASMEVEDSHPIEMPPPPAASSSTTAATAAAAAPFQFDLEAYISRYEPLSETRLQRLLFLASTLAAQSQSSAGGDSTLAAAEMARQAYRMAEAQCRDACNGRTYRRVFGGHFAAAASGGEYFYIGCWIAWIFDCLEAGKKDTAARKGRWYLY